MLEEDSEAGFKRRLDEHWAMRWQLADVSGAVGSVCDEAYTGRGPFCILLSKTKMDWFV